MNDHIATEASFEHWPLNADGERILKDGEPVIKNLRFGKVSLAALKELEDYLRREPLDTHLQQIEVQRIPRVAEIMVRAAVELGDKRRIGTPDFDRAVKTLSGMAYLMYLSLRAQQPEMSPKLALKILSDEAQHGRQEQLQGVLFKATGFVDESGGNSSGKDEGPDQASPTAQS